MTNLQAALAVTSTLWAVLAISSPRTLIKVMIVNSYVNWTLKNLENLRLQGSSKIKGIGNALNNTITGTLWMAKQAATLYMVLVATTPLMVAAVLTILWWVGQ